MDHDVEHIHNILLDAQLPSSINDLKNPTEEYVLRLLKAFLTRFSIDITLIDKLTSRQQEIMLYSEGGDIVGIINLHSIMVQICEKLFITDLGITDITSPGPKKLRKQAKFMANFILYVTNKESDIEDRVSEILGKTARLQDIRNRIQEIRTEINNKALYKAAQLKQKEKYQKEIMETTLRIKANQEQLHQKNNELDVVKQMKQKAMERHEKYKTQASKLHEAVSQLQAEIVVSPEEYHERLQKLDEERNRKEQECAVMTEAFHEKKQLIERGQNTLMFVEEQVNKYSDIEELCKQLKKGTAQIDNLKKQIEVLEATQTDWEKEAAAELNHCTETDTIECHDQYEQRLLPLRNLYTELQSKKKSWEEKEVEEKVRHNKQYLEKTNAEGLIKTLEEETANFTQSCQELYDNEIMKETTVWKTLDKK